MNQRQDRIIGILEVAVIILGRRIRTVSLGHLKGYMQDIVCMGVSHIFPANTVLSVAGYNILIIESDNTGELKIAPTKLYSDQFQPLALTTPQEVADIIDTVNNVDFAFDLSGDTPLLRWRTIFHVIILEYRKVAPEFESKPSWVVEDKARWLDEENSVFTFDIPIPKIRIIVPAMVYITSIE